jgi:hypothetical protein
MVGGFLRLSGWSLARPRLKQSPSARLY